MLRAMMRNLVACMLFGCAIAGAAQAATVSFDTTRPIVVFRVGGSWYDDGDVACVVRMNLYNAGQSSFTLRNPEYFLNKPGGLGEGCEWDLYRRADDSFVGRVFWQSWVTAQYSCVGGYTGPHVDALGNKECRRHFLIPVVKPAICPNPTVGHPVEVASADKALRITDLQNVDGLGFSRSYRSRPRASGGIPYPSALGSGWYGEHFQRLKLTSGGSSALPPMIHMVRPDGSPWMFAKDDNGSWVSERDALCNRLAEVTLDDGAPGYELSLAGGDVELFDAEGLHVETRYVDGARLLYAYGPDGLLNEVVNTKGRSLSFGYDIERRLKRVADSGGGEVLLAYNSSGVLASVDHGNSAEFYFYEARFGVASYLTRMEDEDGNVVTAYTYDSQGNPTSTERVGALGKFTLNYATSGKIIVGEPDGATSTYSFHLELGRRVIDRVDRSCAGCTGTSQQFGHDVNLNANAEITGSHRMCRSYDLARNLELTRAEGVDALFNCGTMSGGSFTRKTSTDWHPTFRSPTERRTYDETGALIATTSWTYNTRGQVLQSTRSDPVSGVSRAVTTTYCEQGDIDVGACPLLGLVVSIDGPRTDVADITSYSYRMADEASCATAPTTCQYRKGDLWKVTNAVGQMSETLRYDSAGRVLSVTDSNGVTTDMEYHPRGWLTAARKVQGSDDTSESDDRITRFEYESKGLVSKTILPDGSYTGFTYDAAQRLVGIADAEGNRISYTLDNAGSRIREDTIGHNGTVMRTLSRVYNQLGQLQTSKDAYERGTGFTYDANGNANTVTDALGRTADNDYDPLNRLTRTIQDLGGINATTQFEYDAQDNLTAVVDPKSLTTRYTYNGLGDLTTLDSPDTGTTTYTYDSAGNRRTRTDARSELTAYDYDVLNRLTSIGYSTPALNVTYTYDLASAVCDPEERFTTGRLSALTDASGTTQYCYDRFGQLTRKVQTTNGTVLSLRYAYTTAGQLSSITYPDGTLVDYQRDALGRTTSVGVTASGGVRQVLLHEATYYPFGPAAEWVFGNGRLFQRTLNQNYQPGVVQDGFPGGLSLGYEFDAVGNLSTLRNGNQTDPPQRLFGYDALNRLAETRDGATGAVLQGYTYDATGNRQSATAGATTTAYTTEAGSHRLSAVGPVPRSYDPAGSTTSIGGTARRFVYDAAGRMSQVLRDNAVAMNYRYNGKGEQVHRYLGSGNIYTMYDETGRWLGDYDSAGAPIQQTIWLDDLPVGVIAGGHLHYIEADHLGTPRVVIDPQRDVAVWRWELTGEAFGDSVPDQDPDGDASEFVFNMRFPGQRYDAASGLNYNYFRDYEPGSGRYVQSDPVGLGDGPSTYGYAGANSLVLMDPYGRSARPSSSYNFQNHKEVARAEAVAKLQRCVVEDCDSGNPYKITQGELEQVIAKVISVDIHLDAGDKDCGFSYPNINQNEIGIGGAIFSSSCCPIASVIAHEAAHLVLGAPLGVGQGTENEGKARYIQQQCFGCAKAYH